jgi:hypothetical protein
MYNSPMRVKFDIRLMKVFEVEGPWGLYIFKGPVSQTCVFFIICPSPKRKTVYRQISHPTQETRDPLCLCLTSADSVILGLDRQGTYI